MEQSLWVRVPLRAFLNINMLRKTKLRILPNFKCSSVLWTYLVKKILSACDIRGKTVWILFRKPLIDL